MMFYILASLFSVVTFPSLVQKIAQGIPIRAAIKKSLLLMILITIPLITGMTFGSSLIMQILFGASFVAAAPILAILSLTYIPVFTRSVLNNAILAKNIQRKFVWANIAGVMVNIGLDFLLVPHYLGVGAAIASVAGLTTISVATAVILWKK
jgi:PST family polysaccharide transporter